MTATVYKARYDDGRVEVDWLIVSSLEQLETALADGWHPSEAKARIALAAVPAVVPAVVETPEGPLPIGTSDDVYVVPDDASSDDDKPRRSARKKR